MVIGGIDTTYWTEEQRAELMAAGRQAEEARADIAGLEAEERSPAALISKAQEEAKRAAQALADKRAIVAAEKKYGKEDVAVIETAMGAIVMRTPTRTEAAELNKRVAAAQESGRDEEADEINRDGILSVCIHPAPERIRAIFERWGGVEGAVNAAYLDLFRGAGARLRGK